MYFVKCVIHYHPFLFLLINRLLYTYFFSHFPRLYFLSIQPMYFATGDFDDIITEFVENILHFAINNLISSSKQLRTHITT